MRAPGACARRWSCSSCFSPKKTTNSSDFWLWFPVCLAVCVAVCIYFCIFRMRMRTSLFWQSQHQLGSGVTTLQSNCYKLHLSFTDIMPGRAMTSRVRILLARLETTVPTTGTFSGWLKSRCFHAANSFWLIQLQSSMRWGSMASGSSWGP